MVMAFDLIERVAQYLQEIFVGSEDFSVEAEFDHGLRLADGGELALIVRALQFLLGDIGRVFHDLEWFTIQITNWVVARLNPNLPAALGNALVLIRVVLSATELFPEQPVFCALPVVWVDEHRMVLALDLIECVAQRLQKVFVGIEDFSIEREFDDRLRHADRGELSFVICALHLLLGDIRGELYHFDRLALTIKDRVVARLNPDFPAALA